jgi:hypothetical protein
MAAAEPVARRLVESLATALAASAGSGGAMRLE